MNIFIETIKISNFLSFFGTYEVNVKPFSAIMCNYSQGKDDFLQCLNFVFGGKLDDLKADNLLQLVHKVLREEFLINPEIKSYVEVKINLVQDNKNLKFCRRVKYENNGCRCEYKISDLVTSKLQYEEKLTSLGLHIQRKNLIFYNEYFNNVIWGSSEDLEFTLNACLREPYVKEKWDKARKELKYLTQMKNRMSEKNYFSLKRSYSVVAKYTKQFEVVIRNRKSFLLDIPNDFEETSFSKENIFLDSNESSSVSTKTNEELKISDLEKQEEALIIQLQNLKSKEAVFTSLLYHEEIKLAAKPVNVCVLENRISAVKNRLKEKEMKLADIWKEIVETNSEVKNLSEKIISEFTSLRKIQINLFRQNRFTAYGRFSDYLQPGHCVQLLKEILGPEIFHAHLCDFFEEALDLLKFLKVVKYENREVFISFDNYSYKLKDLITASGENGIEMSTLEQLLIFLCKLKQYQLIDEVPIIIPRDFDYDEPLPCDYTVYSENGLSFTSEGIISLKVEDEMLFRESEEIQENFTRLQTEEGLKYQNLNYLLHKKWETLFEINSLENDVAYIKYKWRKSAKKPSATPEAPQPPDIYKDYTDIFNEYAEEWKKCEENVLQLEETIFSKENNGNSSTSKNSSEESLNFILTDLEKTVQEKNGTLQKLEYTVEKLRSFDVGLFHEFKLQDHFVKFNSRFDKSTLFFEKEFKKLKALVTEEDFDEFKGSREWRNSIINSLINDFNEIKRKLKSSSDVFQTISTARKRKIYPLVEHLNRYLSSTFKCLIDDSLPFIELSFTSEEESLQLKSAMGEDLVNHVEIKHFNTFLKFIAALSLFLELANFDKIPLIIFDNIEEYFPLNNDNVEAIVDSDILEKIVPDIHNVCFHLLMRVGQYMEYYIKKNTHTKQIRNNGYKGYENGPKQIIFFAKGDLIHAANHYLWIHCQTLPEEYITENCDSFSEILEINVNI